MYVKPLICPSALSRCCTDGVALFLAGTPPVSVECLEDFVCLLSVYIALQALGALFSSRMTKVLCPEERQCMESEKTRPGEVISSLGFDMNIKADVSKWCDDREDWPAIMNVCACSQKR